MKSLPDPTPPYTTVANRQPTFSSRAKDSRERSLLQHFFANLTHYGQAHITDGRTMDERVTNAQRSP